VLGLGFQMGPPRFRESLAIGQGGKKVVIDDNEAKRIVYLYRNKNHRIAMLWTAAGNMLNDMRAGISGELCPCVSYDSQGMIFPSGMRLDYDRLELDPEGKNHRYVNNGRMNARNPENGWTHIYGGKTVENLVQRIARDIIMEMMNKIAVRYPVVLQVHDEIVCHVSENDAAACAGYMHKVMTTPPKWMPGLPVACEYKIAHNYGDAK
jgi:DNA polymerase